MKTRYIYIFFFFYQVSLRLHSCWLASPSTVSSHCVSSYSRTSFSPSSCSITFTVRNVYITQIPKAFNLSKVSDGDAHSDAQIIRWDICSVQHLWIYLPSWLEVFRSTSTLPRSPEDMVFWIFFGSLWDPWKRKKQRSVKGRCVMERF